MVGVFDLTAKKNDLFGKLFGFHSQWAIGHAYHLGDSIAHVFGKVKRFGDIPRFMIFRRILF